MQTSRLQMNEKGDIIVTAPKLEPYTYARSAMCPMCGNTMRALNWWRDFLGKEPAIVIDPTFCPGGRPLSERPTGMNAVVEQAVTGSVTERTFVCAGIEEPHLHVKCLRCHYVWLTRTRSQQKGYSHAFKAVLVGNLIVFAANGTKVMSLHRSGQPMSPTLLIMATQILVMTGISMMEYSVDRTRKKGGL